MRTQGRLTEWNDDRGFGFVTPLSGGPTLFVHVSEFPTGTRRPIPTDLVTFEESHDERGRLRAVNVEHLTPVRQKTPTRIEHRTPAHHEGLVRATSGHRSHRLASPQLIPFLVIALLVTIGLMGVSAVIDGRSGAATTVSQPGPGDTTLKTAFDGQQSGVQVAGQGTVVRVLPDDNNGSRHQRFILELRSGQTLLVAHNIDIAPRIPSLPEGASVSFSGVYEWNAQGGVIHWTHHDPGGKHAAGWLDYAGLRYE